MEIEFKLGIPPAYRGAEINKDAISSGSRAGYGNSWRERRDVSNRNSVERRGDEKVGRGDRVYAGRNIPVKLTDGDA